MDDCNTIARYSNVRALNPIENMELEFSIRGDCNTFGSNVNDLKEEVPIF